MLFKFFVFHLDKSGNDDNDEHLKNILLIYLTLLVFHFDISGNDCNDEQLKNILNISVTLVIPFNLISNFSFLFENNPLKQ